MSSTREDLLNAIERRDAAGVESALNAGVDPNAPDKLGRPALWRAVGQGGRDIVSHLLTHGADPNRQTEQGNTALMLAAARGDRTLVDMLIHAGADPDHRNRWDFRPIDWAGWADNAQELRAILPGG